MEKFTEYRLGQVKFAVSETFAKAFGNLHDMRDGAFLGQVYIGTVCAEFTARTVDAEVECNVFAISDRHDYGSTKDGRGYDVYLTTTVDMPIGKASVECAAAYLLGELLVPMAEEGLLKQMAAPLDTWES